MATTKVVDVIDRASIILQDSANVRFPNAELLQFFNDAQKEVVLYRPDANMKNESISGSTSPATLVDGSKQSIPAGGVRLVDVVRNVGGAAITQVDRKILDETLPNWHNAVQDASRKVEHFIFDPADPKTFYVYPKAIAASDVLEIMYSATPSDIAVSNFSTDTQTISVDDIYANSILDYVLYRCYQKDSEFAGNSQRAMMHLTGFSNSLGVKTQVDASLTPLPATLAANVGRG